MAEAARRAEAGLESLLCTAIATPLAAEAGFGIDESVVFLREAHVDGIATVQLLVKPGGAGSLGPQPQNEQLLAHNTDPIGSQPDLAFRIRSLQLGLQAISSGPQVWGSTSSSRRARCALLPAVIAPS